MRFFKKLPAIGVSIAFCMMGLFCGGNKTDVAGNGSSSETVIGKLHAVIIDSLTNKGVPGIPVVLVRTEFNPIKDTMSQELYRNADTSDSSGRIELLVPDTGSYNLISTSDYYKYRLYLPSVIIDSKDSLDLGNIQLRCPGTVLVNIDSAIFSAGSYLIIPGTVIRQSVLSPGIIELMAPVGVIHIVYVDTSGDSISGWSNKSIAVIERVVSTPFQPVANDTLIGKGETDTFTTGGSSTTGNQGIEYRFDWNDGYLSPWSTNPVVMHSWSSAGTYLVRSQARNTVDTTVESEWSTWLTVQVVVYPPPVVYGDSITDIDGNVYHTVIIGNQTWTIENLRTTKLNDGTAIPFVVDSATWANTASGTPAYCFYNNTTNLDSINKFGALYNWYTVDTKKLGPAGWHVPTDAEWDSLQNYLMANGFNGDGTTDSNKIAKSMAARTDWAPDINWAGNTSWLSPGNDLTKNNSSGFSALPGGYRSSVFTEIGSNGYWWSATELNVYFVYYRYLYFGLSDLKRSYTGKIKGYSVRLLKDN